jgi:peptidoglycan/LPS O-acetylase OafA/YrhL
MSDGEQAKFKRTSLSPLGYSLHWEVIRGLSIVTMIIIHTARAQQWRPFAMDLSVLLFPAIEPILFLSGFLIALRTTSYLVDEGASLSLVMKYFGIRRVLRTWPLYFGLVAICFYLLKAIGTETGPPLWRYLTFTMNFGLRVGPFDHLWSTCLEEWCYLLFLFMIPLLKWRHTFWIFALLALSAVIGRGLVLHQSGILPTNYYFSRFHFSTFYHWDSFWLGCCFGSWCSNGGLQTKLFTKRYQVAILVAAIALILTYTIIFQMYWPKAGWVYQLLNPEIGSLVSMAMVVGLPAVPDTWLRWTGMKWLGAMSYSIYLFHTLLMFNISKVLFQRKIMEPGSVSFIVAEWVGMLCGCYLIYFYFERPLLNFMKSRFIVPVKSVAEFNKVAIPSRTNKTA